MTTNQIVNAAPMSIMLGISDKSTRALTIEAEALPSHLAKVIVFAKWGPTEDQLVGGNGFSQTYHVDSLDQRKKWANHATEMLSSFFGAGSVAVTKRVVPDDAPPPSTLRVYADFLPVQQQTYVRNSDGSIKTDSTGAPVPASGKIPGFLVKFVQEQIPTVDGESEFGLGVQKAGDLADEVSETQSVRLPLWDAEVPFQGSHGDNQGMRMWAPTLLSQNPLDTRLLTSVDQMAYPIRMACVRRVDANSTGDIVTTEDGEQYIDACLKPGAIHPSTTQELYAGDVFIDAYQTIDDPVALPFWGPFGKFHLYDDNILNLLTQLYEAEKDRLPEFSDFKGVDGEQYRFNLLGCCTSGGVPYESVQLVTGTANSVRLTEASTLYASGGGDGTMNNTTFAALVSKEMTRYSDPNDEMTDMALHPEKIFYDSGFPLATKYDLFNFIGYRKDTFVGIATYEVGTPRLTASAESALGVALRTRAQNYPDSEYFGTPVVRAAIFSRHGKKLNTQYKGDLPLIHEWASKAAQYMGASTGIWNSTYNFDSGENAKITMFTDINVKFTPGSVRNKDWSNGLNWVEAFQRKTTYFPASKTVYDNDTSVLTSIFTALICGQVQAIGNQVRKEFSGSSKLSDLELIDKINKRVVELSEGRFDGRVTIIPKAYITVADAARGYSWTLPIEVYAANMKTVGTISVESYREEDLVQ